MFKSWISVHSRLTILFYHGNVETLGLKNNKNSFSFLNEQVVKAGINFNINLNPLITQKINVFGTGLAPLLVFTHLCPPSHFWDILFLCWYGDSNSTKHWILLTCSAGSSRKVTPIQRLYFPPFHNKGGSHLQRFLTTFWTPWKAIEGKSIISLSFIFLYQTITKNKKWRYWCHLNMFCWHCSENEPTCVGVCLNCCPKNGTVRTRGKFFFYTDVSKCSLYTIYVLTAVPPRLSDSCNFITVLLVTREPEQTTLLFWSAACCVTPHGLHTADRL